jgi:peptidoglycan hydrolase-like protein with peptidoglycan-binding domain
MRKEDKSMVPLRFESLLAGALVLSLATPGWTAEGAPTKGEKMESEAPMKGSEDTKKLQEALKANGHDPGPIDGVFGSKTRSALSAFQEASGMKSTGRLDDQTAEKLGIPKPSAGKKDVKEKKEEKK